MSEARNKKNLLFFGTPKTLSSELKMNSTNKPLEPPKSVPDAGGQVSLANTPQISTN